MKTAVVIGAGIAGIAASIRMAKKGYQVAVYEANDYPGGKLSAFTLGKYRFDAGPSLFTMPDFVTELFDLSEEDHRDYFNFKKKEIACKYFWEDQTQITAYDDQDLFFKEIQEKLNIDTKPLKKYLTRAKKKFDLTAPLFLEKSLHQLKTFLNLDTLKALSSLSLYEINQTLHGVNSKQLKEPHLIQMYDRYATYNGSSPFKTPGIMTLVQHLEQEFGTFIPEGGMEQISHSLYELAKRQGVKFHFSEQVEEIITDQGRATGVVVNNIKINYDVIISNMDVYPTYRKLLKNKPAPERVLSQERSSSAVIFYWGIKHSFPNLDLHNIFFANDYKNEFDFIFNKNEPADDFTIYLNISSKDVPKDAPDGCENWFVMINTPSDKGQDWDEITTELRKRVIHKLNKILKTDLEKFIEVEQELTPPMIEEKTASYGGALYGSSSNNKMAAFLRHPNFTSKIKNLYFCGGSVHPGGGIPLCLLSAKITTDLIPKGTDDTD